MSRTRAAKRAAGAASGSSCSSSSRIAQRGPAAGGVVDHEVVAARIEGAHVRARQVLREPPHPGVGLERAAAALPPRHGHLATREHEQAHRLVVDAREHHLHHAGGEEGGARPRHARGMEDERIGAHLHPRAGRERRRHPLESALAAGQERRDHLPAAHGEVRQQGARGPRAQERLEHRVLHQAHQVGGAVHGRAVGHQPHQGPLAEPARERALAHAALELPARHLEQPAVGHARGAGGLAGAAAQAMVEVLEQRVAGRDARLGEAAHEVEAPARRVGLELERAVGRAGGQAQPAVDA